MLNEKAAEAPSEDAVDIAGDLNGHLRTARGGYSSHGGFGYGARNVDGERIPEYADSHNLSIANTVFRKRDSHSEESGQKAVAVAKAAHCDDLSDKLETRDGERHLYRLAKARHHQTEDIEKILGINDENGHLLTKREGVMKRWHDYLERISTV
ncbi:unnamed protein product [Heligmosomoides polygyrus]|uniref:Uncharacterized protein n=1 Tax=Heligmosomoides polygyrus TaxID=6339 RepID=A0A3P8FLH0_HELPZ|nr:unnamed protein product [Heligmosomoides polygyrus]